MHVKIIINLRYFSSVFYSTVEMWKCINLNPWNRKIIKQRLFVQIFNSGLPMSLTPKGEGSDIVCHFSLPSSTNVSTYDYAAVCLDSSSEGDYITYAYASGNNQGNIVISCDGYEDSLKGKKLVVRYYNSNGKSILQSQAFTYSTSQPVTPFIAKARDESKRSAITLVQSAPNITVKFALDNSCSPSTSDYVAICEQNAEEGQYFTYTYATGNEEDQVEIVCEGYEGYFDDKVIVIRYYNASGKIAVESHPFRYSPSNPIIPLDVTLTKPVVKSTSTNTVSTKTNTSNPSVSRAAEPVQPAQKIVPSKGSPNRRDISRVMDKNSPPTGSPSITAPSPPTVSSSLIGQSPQTIKSPQAVKSPQIPQQIAGGQQTQVRKVSEAPKDDIGANEKRKLVVSQTNSTRKSTTTHSTPTDAVGLQERMARPTIDPTVVLNHNCCEPIHFNKASLEEYRHLSSWPRFEQQVRASFQPVCKPVAKPPKNKLLKLLAGPQTSNSQTQSAINEAYEYKISVVKDTIASEQLKLPPLDKKRTLPNVHTACLQLGMALELLTETNKAEIGIITCIDGPFLAIRAVSGASTFWVRYDAPIIGALGTAESSNIELSVSYKLRSENFIFYDKILEKLDTVPVPVSFFKHRTFPKLQQTQIKSLFSYSHVYGCWTNRPSPNDVIFTSDLDFLPKASIDVPEPGPNQLLTPAEHQKKLFSTTKFTFGEFEGNEEQFVEYLLSDQPDWEKPIVLYYPDNNNYGKFNKGRNSPYYVFATTPSIANAPKPYFFLYQNLPYFGHPVKDYHPDFSWTNCTVLSYDMLKEMFDNQRIDHSVDFVTTFYSPIETSSPAEEMLPANYYCTPFKPVWSTLYKFSPNHRISEGNEHIDLVLHITDSCGVINLKELENFCVNEALTGRFNIAENCTMKYFGYKEFYVLVWPLHLPMPKNAWNSFRTDNLTTLFYHVYSIQPAE